MQGTLRSPFKKCNQWRRDGQRLGFYSTATHTNSKKSCTKGNNLERSNVLAQQMSPEPQ